ncbi:MAG: hypothetical protein HFF36_09635 [Coprobacillus sp.]|nr:hypothetical protein [Coprobacillus sp.]
MKVIAVTFDDDISKKYYYYLSKKEYTLGEHLRILTDRQGKAYVRIVVIDSIHTQNGLKELIEVE